MILDAIFLAIGLCAMYFTFQAMLASAPWSFIIAMLVVLACQREERAK